MLRSIKVVEMLTIKNIITLWELWFTCLMERLPPYHLVNGKNIQRDRIGLNLLCGCTMAKMLMNQYLVMISADRHWLLELQEKAKNQQYLLNNLIREQLES